MLPECLTCDLKLAYRTSEEDLIEKLKDSEFAVEYLNASLEDSDDGADERFLMALRHVAKAHGMAAIAENRVWRDTQCVVRYLENGNPELSSLKAVLDAMRLRLALEQKPQAS